MFFFKITKSLKPSNFDPIPWTNFEHIALNPKFPLTLSRDLSKRREEIVNAKPNPSFLSDGDSLLLCLL